MDPSRPPSPRLPALGLLLLLPLVAAWRPYDSVDGMTTPVGQLAIEWGALNLQLRQPQMTLAVPQLLARLGVGRQLEIGVRGSYRLTVREGGTPWDNGAAAGTAGVYGKWEIISGTAPHDNWPRPAISILGGVNFLTAQSIWGLELRLAGSLWIGPVLTHLNIGFQHDGGPGVLVGAVVSAPLRIGLTPAVELSGEVRFGPRSSYGSVLLSLTQSLPKLPFALDVAVRRGLPGGAPDWTFTAGVTMRLQVFRAAR